MAQLNVDNSRGSKIATAVFEGIRGEPIVSSILVGFSGLLTLHKLALLDGHYPLIEYQTRFDASVDVTVRAFVRKL